MRIQDLDEGVGRIIKGVNTTQDVGVDQTKIEAAKFGNSVDKDGRPPTMSSAVKGKSTNVLFNLGLTEGIKLKLERDKHIDVLHITDTNNKHRIEVRGKKGYESGGYDKQDKLHQVLDRVGKAANISELMNGEVVSINPNHPQGSRAIRTAKDVLQTESSHSIMKQAIIEGGHSLDDLDKPTPTIAELVKMHGVPAKQILKQLEMGIEAEYEHTSDFEVAKQIAMDHIAEDPAYYDKLKFIESPRPRMSPADIAADTRASSTGVSQAELQRLTSQYRSQPPNAIASLLNRLDADTVIGIALAIGAPHLSFLQKFLIKRGIRFSRNVMQRAMAQVEGITEALDQPYPVRWTMKDDDEWEGKAKTEAGDSIQIFITQGHNNHKWEVDFYVGGSMQVTGKGDQFRVFATVVSAVKKWWAWLSKSKQPVEAIIFSAFKGNKSAKGSTGRSSLYNRFANQFARSIGFTVSTVDGSDNIKFVLSNPNYKNQQTENFADSKNQIKEALDNPYPFKLTGPDESQSFVATAQTPNGPLIMDFSSTDFDDFSIDFAVAKSMGKTGAGDEFRVFATVVAMMKKWIDTVGIEHVESFDFGANKDEHASDGRAKLYARFAKQLASQLGWKLEQSTTANNSTAFFKLTNPKPVPRDDEYWDALEENFADGKVKGKSRPGRVKRAGASCNGSVTALRKRAKNASGEKAKMYHWCANMKSGRKKK